MAGPIRRQLCLLLLLLSGASLCLTAAPCPRSCACPQPTELHCTFRSLVSVPHNIHPHVERINLGFNSISSLSEKSLSGLTRLELLLVHGNDLQSLPDGAFKDLSALQMLKLSYNKVREVSRHTFVGLWSLARLHLDHNSLESLDPDTFHGLTNLKLLQLEGNRIKRLHPSTFTTFTLLDRFHLSTLKHLYLSNNSLSVMPGQVLETMPQLENLFLHGNPWVCDCNMRWMHRWAQTAPGVLKCKKDRTLPGGQLCPICSSPRNLYQKPLQALDNMICSSPIIKSKDQHLKPEEINHKFTFLDDFKQPFGNISLGLSDEHGNKVELECGVDEPKDASKISFEQIDDAKMASNITLSLDLDCDVDRERYERLWRLIAYYASVPAHLKRGIMLTKNPYPTYVYKQESDKDVAYYTGVKANIMALPSWLMQSYADLQLNRQGSSGKRVKLSFTTQLSQNLETEMIRREVRTWVMTEETNSKFKTAILGKTFNLQCNVQSSGEPVITWILPDGTKLVAPSDNSDERLSISADGKLEIRTAEHKDCGNYYCVAKVDDDIAILPFYVSVQDPSNPQPGEDQATTSIELLAGNSLNLDCNAFGSPDPEVNWIIPNGNIASFKFNTSRVLVFSNGTLHIAQSLPPDSGLYKCVVLNQYGVDTKTTKVTVNKHPGMVKPLRRFPLRPQSASGVNTKIKVPIPDLEEGSGDTDEGSKSVRKILPVRNGIALSRTPWRRPPIMMRKPTSQNPQNGRNILDSRRRMNMSKTKINPERWADILAKIRIKNGQFATTVSPVIATTPKITTPFQELTTLGQKETNSQQYTTQFLTNLSHETIEGSSDGVTLNEKAAHEIATATISTQENAYSLHTTTLKPMTSPSFPNLQTTTSSNVFFLPQTTSRPFQVVKYWQEVLNTPGKSATYSHHEDSEVKGGRADDPKRAKTKGNRKNKSKISKFHRKVQTGQVFPTVDPVTSKREDDIIPQEPKDVGLLQIEAIIDLVSPTTAQIWKRPTSTTLQLTKRRNGNRKKNPNRRKNKINKHAKNNGIIDEKVSQVSIMPTELEIEDSVSLEPTVPLENGSTARSMSQKKAESNTKKTKIVDDNVVQGFIPTAFPETRLDTLPSKPVKKFTSYPLPPVKPVSQPPMENAITERSSEKPRHAKRKLIQSRQRYTGLKGQKHLVNGTGEQLSRRSSSLASLTEHKVEEMHHFQDTGALLATTGINFEIQAATKRPENTSKTLIQDDRPDNVESASITASTTALPTTTLNYDFTKMPTTELKLKSAKQAITISSNTKTPRKQNESVIYSNIFPPKTTVTAHLLAYTTKQVTDISKSHEDLQTQDERVILSQNASKQATSIPVTVNGNQNPLTPTNSISLQIANAKTTVAPSTQPPPRINFSPKNHLFFNVTTKHAPMIKVRPKNDGNDQDNETNMLISSPNPILKSTIMPSMLNYTTHKVPSITTSMKIATEAKPMKSSHISVQNSSLSPSLARNTTQPAITVSPKLDQSTQGKLLKTSVTPTLDATQQPTRAPSALADPVTQSPNHRMNQFISLNPSIPTINLKTTPAPTFTPFLAKLWTEEAPQASTTSKLPSLATYPRGKPRITKGNFQIMSVKAETDAILPCTANGEPKPFLSWTKVSTGISIPQNTRLQRYEVHKNGTLIIRNIQPMDGGEYLCTVQNQYGSDEMLTNLVVLSQHPKILQPRHRDISVNLGSSIDLDCQVEGHPKPRVTWVLPNHAQMAATPFGLASNRVSILQNGTLRLVQAGFSDRGIYKCVGSSTSGVDTVSIRLYVSSLPPIFQQTPIENVTASENGAVYLDCTASGSPQPTIRWITPDSIQLASSQYLIGQNLKVFPNGTLVIENLTQGNAGKYECLASNMMGTSKRMVNLFVKSKMLMAKARITMTSPKLTQVVYGGKLKLDCVAKGDPEPRVIWRMPSKKLVDAQYSFDPRIQVHPNGSLTVHSVTDKDEGEYLCVARNKMGDDYVVLGVEILTKPAKIEHKKPRSSQEVIYGGDLKVDCVASGLPNPEISWALPDGTMVNHEKQRDRAGRSRRYVVFDNGTLFFNDVGMREEGDYTCYAENQLGKDEMKVYVKVKSASSSPQIQNKTEISPVQVIYGENLTLQCNAKGDPTPTYTWISPRNRIIDSNKEKFQVFNNGTLIVQRVQRFDAGDYTCIARNSYGQDNKIVKVEVLVTPPVISNNRNNFKVSKFPNDKILLDCIAKGTPNPRIMWVLPGNVILPAPYYSNRITVFQNGSLEIRSAKTSDSGQLACIARNEGGEVRLAVSLDVKDANARMQASGTQLDDVSLTAGNAMTLNCSFDGNNIKQITWVLPNGTPLLSGARLAKFFHRQDGSLIISNPTLAEAGTYRCLGRSSTSQVEQFVQLTPGRKPVIANKYDSPVNVLNGDMLMLHCVTNGDPLRLTWTLPSGVVLNRPQKAGRYSVLQNGTLAIKQVSVYDRGLYACRAANEYGSSVMSVSVIVIAYPPRITNGPNSVTYAKRGVAIQLNCGATGIPNVEVAWETPDKARLVVGAQPRLFGNKYLHPQGSLVIQNPSSKDAGVYKCTARNAIGVDSKTTYLNVY